MMIHFLRRTKTLELKPPVVGDFLMQATRAFLYDKITVNDWGYLARLVAFKIQRIINNVEEEQEGPSARGASTDSSRGSGTRNEEDAQTTDSDSQTSSEGLS